MNQTLHQIITIGLLVISATLWAEEERKATDYNSIIRSLAPIEGQVVANGTIDLDIRFKLGSAELSSQAHEQLQELGRALTSSRLENIRIGIYGHTDSRGSAERNLLLSQKRAESVVSYLLEYFAINKEQIEAKGFGEEKLKNSLNPEAAENRRVEIVNLGVAADAESEDKAVGEDGKIRW